MPYTDDFKKILNKFKRQYPDKAKAHTFAFEEAFKLKIPTFRKRTLRFQIQNKNRR